MEWFLALFFESYSSTRRERQLRARIASLETQLETVLAARDKPAVAEWTPTPTPVLTTGWRKALARLLFRLVVIALAGLGAFTMVVMIILTLRGK